ncbi:DNA mismatch repair protein Msh5 [Aspergillus eucalypticola CBS 122712]|uniref:DNA mismatch repair protein MSH5 n=1 Tax=Aspergillus eucalypticola (strain CBS 122712 / IBT 29274) TaxID=1448314 RepID=A0A317W496_ASPEC|nr:DNA mismatch repair protein Msh5 [Aspergillus eucalypticola CBS 122712]PWY81426.1 DNA mismatch repair protein Msh5 [Aspergillus eucalypticola CBS 122712]
MEPRTKRKRTTRPRHVDSLNPLSNHDDFPRPRTSGNLPPTSQETLRARALPSNNAEQFQSGSAMLDYSIDDELEQVVVAVDMRDSGTVGCSYYSALEEKVYLLGDLRHSSKDIIDSLVLQTKPTVLLISPRVDPNNLQERPWDKQISDVHSYVPYELDVRPSQEFNYSNAKNKLIALEISSRHENRIKFFVPHSGLVDGEQLDTENLDLTLQEGKLLHVSGSIDMENTVTIGCAGAILAYLQRRRASMSMFNERASGIFRVSSVEMFTLSGTMFVNGRTLLSLQIMESETHPSMVNQGPGRKSTSSKEGLSVYGLFQRFASTPQGRNKLKQMFLRPSVELDVINERHSFISVYQRADNFNPLEKMVKSLKHIKNLQYAMINLRKGISTGSGKIMGFKATVWATLLAFAFYGIDIHDALRETSDGANLALHNKVLIGFAHSKVDIDSSEEQGRTVVKPGIDRELDRIKDRYDGMNSLLKQVAVEIATTIPESYDIDVNVIYFPQLGFNIAIPLNEAGDAAYRGVEDDRELMFFTENRAYFKDFRMREMDEKLGDIYGIICEKEIEIVYDLAQRVLQYETVLLEASDICGQIDSLLAMAQAASFYRLVRPKMVEGDVINIRGGRHILQELTVSSYVPNDTFLFGRRTRGEPLGPLHLTPNPHESDYGPSMLLLTGPNYSGKSVYMKQVALVVYLAQVGSFVPAESAELGIVDKILVKSNTQDSVSQIQSTFMNDLQQLSFDLKQVTGRSLLLIDEFGKGTNENDGIGLACGVLEHLLNREDAPKVIAATHFHEILANGYLKPRPQLQLGHMEVRVHEEPGEAEDQITYLYNFRLGRSDQSFGTICAAMSGISQTIVDRADEIASLSARGENLIAACAVLSAQETQALEDADKLAREFLSLNLSAPCDVELMRDRLEKLFEGSGAGS